MSFFRTHKILKSDRSRRLCDGKARFHSSAVGRSSVYSRACGLQERLGAADSDQVLGEQSLPGSCGRSHGAGIQHVNLKAETARLTVSRATDSGRGL